MPGFDPDVLHIALAFLFFRNLAAIHGSYTNTIDMLVLQVHVLCGCSFMLLPSPAISPRYPGVQSHLRDSGRLA
ncbi:hypothetical protein C2E23DRAFT_812266 [Lenzites betulinus]|nr:hypothetical protein C2E23DRAFT_840043 [Lenzites betulinus]KAH9850636.1 hypothetical protein C2E23DRAFT_834773 [Lenzites betulinus]KAH9855419.1 hypothetical protein C2E23DRAFT_813329 [Lenzites betulinus]KAH9855864.1 hypothetical protein C2E23DRAFT_812266 [Lenzites betulinus]